LLREEKIAKTNP